ncbi:MAG: type I 3-dehydroquinate dehydratase [Planctomycetes bacterium]|nr:type I 3-dehydroquinate dehydratase [Planctomycetota bacterium]MCH9723752.1 type I 3-dehydroquinate dehydratase [Planctomycetota bacterium]MCH9776064.1 type I 3-dehydroquinate dehydratase [Planctomycetota bacterium]MCH9789805.1 type I 3-dehydroquinate dehydratase [Planctomycetota bacterium]
MICISVTPESRNFAKVDILNAAAQSDMVELCLDRLIKTPDIGDLISGFDVPILVSCRRPEEGGQFKGTETERINLLRQAIIAEPAYIELDLETAKQVPRFGKTKRVISYTSLKRPLNEVDDIFDEMADAKADIIKFTWPTPTLQTAWPLLAAISQKREIPVVGLGLGPAGITFSLLGVKYGSPWTYAALEKGMEAFDGQPTVSELDEVFGFQKISSKTKFIGVAGLGVAERRTIEVFNKASEKLGLDYICLPLVINDFKQIHKMLGILKIRSLVVSPRMGEFILPLAEHLEESSEKTGYGDLQLNQPDGWHAYDTVRRSAVKSLEASFEKKTPGAKNVFQRKNILVVGKSGLTKAIVYSLSQQGGVVSVTSDNDKAAQGIARTFDVRYVPFANLYDTLTDIVVQTDPELVLGSGKTQLNAAYLRESMTVMDVSQLPEETELMREAESRGCEVVCVDEIYRKQLNQIFKAITGVEIPGEVFESRSDYTR